MAKRMKVVVLGKNMQFNLQNVLTPNIKNDLVAPKKYDTTQTFTFPKEGLVLLGVKAASICGTDLHILDGTHGSAPPVVLGHEYVGKVLEVGSSVRNVKRGDFVGVDPNIKCGFCWFCKNNLPNMCENLTTLGIFVNGGFAPYNVAPATQLYVFPKDLPVEKAVFFEPMSCAVHALERINPQVGDEVLIYGAGPIGCCFSMLCKLSGASQVVMVEPSEYRRKFANRTGAIATKPGNERYFIGEKGFDISIDAAGVSAVVPKMFEHTRPGGKISLFGQQNVNAKVEISPTIINQKEFKIYGSYAAASSFTRTIRVLAQLELEKLISHRFVLADIHKAFDLLRKGEAMEIVITP